MNPLQFRTKKKAMKEQFMAEWLEAKAKNPDLSEESFAAGFLYIRAYIKVKESLKKHFPFVEKKMS